MTGAGALLVGISVDSPERNAAMIEKLELPFPILSDPDRSGAITPFEVADEKDERKIARPATVIIDAAGKEVFRFVSRDFADRIPEDAVIAALERLELEPISQAAPQLGPVEPGPKAMPFEQLAPYFRGARFAVVALSRRYPELADDAAAYIEEVDRYTENVLELFRRKRDRAQGGS
jgi:hypothetical protein